MRLWYLSHRRPAKTQANGSSRRVRPKFRHLLPLNACLKNEFTEDEKYHNLMRWLLTFLKQAIYRRLSLSQSPGDQTKCFELSVVWDSQFVTSFTLYMYTDCLDHCVYNLHVNVFGNNILKFKYPLTELLICHTKFEKAGTEINECWWLLTSKNAVKQCSITKVTKAPLRTLWV